MSWYRFNLRFTHWFSRQPGWWETCLNQRAAQNRLDLHQLKSVSSFTSAQEEHTHNYVISGLFQCISSYPLTSLSDISATDAMFTRLFAILVISQFFYLLYSFITGIQSKSPRSQIQVQYRCNFDEPGPWARSCTVLVAGCLHVSLPDLNWLDENVAAALRLICCRQTGSSCRLAVWHFQVIFNQGLPVSSTQATW